MVKERAPEETRRGLLRLRVRGRGAPLASGAVSDPGVLRGSASGPDEQLASIQTNSIRSVHRAIAPSVEICPFHWTAVGGGCRDVSFEPLARRALPPLPRAIPS